MKFGMPTLIELESLEENVQLCEALGLDFVEINMNMPQFQRQCLSADMLIALQKKHGIFFTFHIGEDVDVGHFDEKVRAVYVDLVLETIDFMRQVGSTKLNMHMHRGIRFTLPTQKICLYEKFKERYLSNINEFRHKIESHVGNTEVQICIENTGDFGSSYLTDAVDLLLKSKVFSLTWDVGHDHSSKDADRPFIGYRKERVSHMHLHDAIGSSNHLELYTGEMDIEACFDFAKTHDLSVVLEVKEVRALKDSVKKMRCLLSGG